jgi:hypothetical protein
MGAGRTSFKRKPLLDEDAEPRVSLKERREKPRHFSFVAKAHHRHEFKELVRAGSGKELTSSDHQECERGPL